MKNYQIDMCHGPLFGKIMLFAFPLMMTYALQLLFNAMDLIVIGHYAPHQAMAAVGATLNLNSLVLNIFMGLSVGTNVIAARFFGAKDEKNFERALHTSMALALYGGIGLALIGLASAKPLLILMKTPEEILPMSCTYIHICFCAIPLIMIYNFGCAVLRAVGDTRRPLCYLISAGIINVILNLFFVIVCKMDVGGVALATAISHGVAALLILRALLCYQGICRLDLKKLRIEPPMLRELLKIGVPAGLQSSCFAISNMMIQSSINSFGSLAMAGTTAVISLEGLVYICSYSFHQTALSFTAQNYGGGKFKRVISSLSWCTLCATVITSLVGILFYIFGPESLGIFNPDPEVIRWGMIRMKYMFTTYGICGIMDVMSGGLRGLGCSLTSAIISLLGACVFRVCWVFTVFAWHPTMDVLVISYPVSWALVALGSAFSLAVICRRIISGKLARKQDWSSYKPGMGRGLRFIGGPK